MLGLFQNKIYKEVCSIGTKNFNNYRDDEEYISLYAFSCLYSDQIDRLAIPIILLRNSKESRANASYFSTILMQKKLLYHSLMDGYDISNLNLATTDYILSKVFDLYVKIGKYEKRQFYIFHDKESPKVTYKLYLQKTLKTTKMIIEEYYDNILVKKHIYW
jgi:hypothetical protein